VHYLLLYEKGASKMLMKLTPGFSYFLTVMQNKIAKWQPCLCMRLRLKKHFCFLSPEDGKAVFTLLVGGSLAEAELLPTQIHVFHL